MIEIIGGGIVLILALLWIVQTLLFYYLEISNNHNSLPFLKTDVLFRLLVFYDKKVKAGDDKIRRVRDLCLALVGYTFITAVLFVVIVVIFDLK